MSAEIAAAFAEFAQRLKDAGFKELRRANEGSGYAAATHAAIAGALAVASAEASNVAAIAKSGAQS